MKRPFPTHYANLKVQENAPDEVIRAAWKTLIQKHHPDRTNNSEEATRITKILNQAYEVLGDPVKRKEYDAWIEEESLKYNTPNNSPENATRSASRPQEHSASSPHTAWLMRGKESIRFVGFILASAFAAAATYYHYTNNEKYSAPSSANQTGKQITPEDSTERVLSEMRETEWQRNLKRKKQLLDQLSNAQDSKESSGDIYAYVETQTNYPTELLKDLPPPRNFSPRYYYVVSAGKILSGTCVIITSKKILNHEWVKVTVPTDGAEPISGYLSIDKLLSAEEVKSKKDCLSPR